MEAAPFHPLSSLLAFWAEAGVDCAYLDAPADRLAEVARRPAALPGDATPPATIGASPPAPPARRMGAAPAPEPEALEAARRAAGAAQDLAALERALDAFPWTGLRPRGAQPVLPRGAGPAPVVLIGQASRIEDGETASEEAFAGRAGRLLGRMLAAGGLEGAVLALPTVFWRPAADRAPTPAEQAVCLPFLERAVALASPRVLVLAGGAAAQALLGRSEGVLALRGRWFEWTPPGGGAPIPALATLHPDMLLRQPVAKAQAWADILTLVSRLDRPG